MFCLPKTAWPPTWTVGAQASNPTFERRMGVQARNLERVGSLVPGGRTLHRRDAVGQLRWAHRGEGHERRGREGVPTVRGVRTRRR